MLDDQIVPSRARGDSHSVGRLVCGYKCYDAFFRHL